MEDYHISFEDFCTLERRFNVRQKLLEEFRMSTYVMIEKELKKQYMEICYKAAARNEEVHEDYKRMLRESKKL